MMIARAVCIDAKEGDSRVWGAGKCVAKLMAYSLDLVTPAALDLRVGKVLEAKRVPDSDKLYVEQIDVGEATPRTICSGLVQHVPLEKFQVYLIIFYC